MTIPKGIPKGFTLGWNILELVIWFIFQDEDKLKTPSEIFPPLHN